jgi:hypothetical protein
MPLLQNFKYHGLNLHHIVDISNYQETLNQPFWNANFLPLLIIQYSKVLISFYSIKSKTLEPAQCRERSSASQTYSKGVGKWEIQKDIGLSCSFGNIQSWCRVLLCFVHYFSMYIEVPKLKGLSNSRFGSIIFLLRMAGIPFKMKKISTIYALYMITVIICSCITYIGMFVDVYINKDELGRTMTNLRVSIPYTNFLFIYFYCRYVRTLVVTV